MARVSKSAGNSGNAGNSDNSMDCILQEIPRILKILEILDIAILISFHTSNQYKTILLLKFCNKKYKPLFPINFMKKYEYKCVSIWGLGKRTAGVLNEYGKEGWELVEVWGIWHYLRREKK